MGLAKYMEEYKSYFLFAYGAIFGWVMTLLVLLLHIT